jgi:hypothetical protein
MSVDQTPFAFDLVYRLFQLFKARTRDGVRFCKFEKGVVVLVQLWWNPKSRCDLFVKAFKRIHGTLKFGREIQKWGGLRRGVTEGMVATEAWALPPSKNSNENRAGGPTSKSFLLPYSKYK